METVLLQLDVGHRAQSEKEMQISLSMNSSVMGGGNRVGCYVEWAVLTGMDFDH